MKRLVRNLTLAGCLGTAVMTCGCGMLMGAGAAVGSTLIVANACTNGMMENIDAAASFEGGPFVQRSMRYLYREADDKVSYDQDYPSKRVTFSNGHSETAMLIVRKQLTDEVNVITCGPILGYTERTFDARVDNVSQNGEDQTVFVGGQVGWGRRESRFRKYVQFVAGQGTMDIPQLDATPPRPNGGFGHRFTRLSGGLTYLPAAWCQLNTGVAVDTVALQHPRYYVDSSPLSPFVTGQNENVTQSLNPFVGVTLRWDL